MTCVSGAKWRCNSFRRLGLATLASAFIVGFAAGTTAVSASAQNVAKDKIPELSGPGVGWLGVGGWLDPPPGMGRGPIRQHPAHAFHGNLDGPGQVTPAIGNHDDPILKPWAAAQMRQSSEEVLSGKRGLAFTAQSRCYPGGVPGQLLFPFEPLFFLQTPKQVWMLWQRDHMVRRVFLTDKHSEYVKPSWFGESIGHYDNGSFVIDTVGLSTANSYIDNYRTPHSEKLHVVERYTISPDGKMLEALVKLDDPDTFNEPMAMRKRWRKVEGTLEETICAENNGDHFGANLFPIPEAKKSDF